MPIHPQSNFNPSWQGDWRSMQRGVDRALSSAPTEVTRSGGGKTPEQIQQDAEQIAGQAKQRDQQIQELENIRRLTQILPQLQGVAQTPEGVQNVAKLGEYLNGLLNRYTEAQGGASASGGTQGGGGVPHYPTAGTPGNPPQYAIPEGGIPAPGGISRSTGIHAVRKRDGGYKLTNVGKVRTDAQRGLPGADQWFQKIMTNAVGAVQRKADKEGGLKEKDLLDVALESWKGEALDATGQLKEGAPDFATFYTSLKKQISGGGEAGPEGQGGGGAQVGNDGFTATGFPGGARNPVGRGGGIPSPGAARSASYQPGAGPGGADLYGAQTRTPAPAESNMMWVTEAETNRRILVPRMDQFDFGPENQGAQGIPQERAPVKKTAETAAPARNDVRYGRRKNTGAPVAAGSIPPQGAGEGVQVMKKGRHPSLGTVFLLSDGRYVDASGNTVNVKG